MLHVGCQADHPILAAVRDEDGRRAYVKAFGEVASGEVAIFNGQGTARVLIKADGTIEANSSTGSALPLATKADLDALKIWLELHTHTITGGSSAGTTTVPLTNPSPTPVGTLKLKGE